MAKKTLNIGSTANDGQGDTLREASGKINDNFTELFSAAFGGAASGYLTPEDINTLVELNVIVGDATLVDSATIQARIDAAGGGGTGDLNEADIDTILKLNNILVGNEKLVDSAEINVRIAAAAASGAGFSNLSGLNTILTDATLVDSDQIVTMVEDGVATGVANLVPTNDGRLSDNRDPNQHANEAHSKNFLDSDNLNTLSKLNDILDDATLVDSATIQARIDAGVRFPNKAAGEPIVIIALGNSDIISLQEATVFMANNSKRLSWVVDTQSWETVDMSSTATAEGWTDGDFFVGYTGGQHGNLPLSTGDYLSKLLSVDCYVIQAGRGGSPISLYAPYGSYEVEFSDEIDTALAAVPGSPTKADIFIFGHHAGASTYNVAEYSETFLRLYDFWTDTRGYIDLETTQVLLPDMYENRAPAQGDIDDWRASAQTMSQTNGNVKSVSSRGLGSTDNLHISGNDLTPYGARVAQAALEAHNPKTAIPAGAPRRILNTIPMTGRWVLDTDNDAAPASGHFGFKQDGTTLQIHKTDNGGVSASLEWVKSGDIFSFTDESATTATMLVAIITEFDNHWEFVTDNAGEASMDTLTSLDSCGLNGDTRIPSGKHDDFLVAPRGGRVIIGESDPLSIPDSPFVVTDYKQITYVPGLTAAQQLGASYTYTNDLGGGALSHERAFLDLSSFNLGTYTYERHSHNYSLEVGKGIKASSSIKGKFSMSIAYDEDAALQEVYSASTTSATGSEFYINSLKFGATMDEERSTAARTLIATTDKGALQPLKVDEYIAYNSLTTTQGTAGQAIYERVVNDHDAIAFRPVLVKFDAIGARNDGGTSAGEFYACTKQAIISWSGTIPVLSNVSTISEVSTAGVTADVVFSINASADSFRIDVNPHAGEIWEWSCIVYREVLPISHSG